MRGKEGIEDDSQLSSLQKQMNVNSFTVGRKSWSPRFRDHRLNWSSLLSLKVEMSDRQLNIQTGVQRRRLRRKYIWG